MHIGDPTFAGWLIFFVYLAVVYRCYLQYVKVKFGFLDHNFWLVIGLFLLLLCINKQLDLQTVFEASMKELAQSHGWYAQRKMMQVTFVALLSISLLTGLVVLRSVLAKACRQHKAVCLGVLLLCVFIVLRAAAFNHLSFLNTHTYWGFNAHSLLELSALCVMFYGTFTLQSDTRHSATRHFADGASYHLAATDQRIHEFAQKFFSGIRGVDCRTHHVCHAGARGNLARH